MANELSGDLGTTPFTDILSVLRLRQATGTLTCTVEGREKQVYVKGGQIIFALSREEKDRLGDVMIATGAITGVQLAKALEEHRRSAGLKKLGAVLVELGYVTPRDLFSGLKAQVRQIIGSLLVATEGPFQFSQQLPSDIIPLQIDLDGLVRQIIEKMKQEQQQEQE